MQAKIRLPCSVMNWTRLTFSVKAAARAAGEAVRAGGNLKWEMLNDKWEIGGRAESVSREL